MPLRYNNVHEERIHRARHDAWHYLLDREMCRSRCCWRLCRLQCCTRQLGCRHVLRQQRAHDALQLAAHRLQRQNGKRLLRWPVGCRQPSGVAFWDIVTLTA